MKQATRSDRDIPLEDEPEHRFRLSAADRAHAPVENKPAPEVRTLEPAEAEALLARLGPGPTAKTAAFRLPMEGQPPPRSGASTALSFPPKAQEAAPELPPPTPLKLTRSAPEGEVEIAPRVSLSFSDPLVPLSSLAQVEQAEPPAHIHPTPPGRWRWLSPRTATFIPEGERLPMATEYTVTLRSDLKSARGAAYEGPAEFSFRTPPPALKDFAPRGDRVDLEPLVLLRFNQAMDPAELLRKLVVRGVQPSLRIATAEEVKADPLAQRFLSEAAHPDRVVALKFDAQLPKNTRVDLTLPAGLLGAEGPLGTTQKTSVHFSTYPPLTVEKVLCGWDSCHPGDSWNVRFSTLLKEGLKISPEDIKVEATTLLGSKKGEARVREVRVYGDSLHLRVDADANTRYRFSLPAEIEDVFGQRLGENGPHKIKVGDARPRLVLPPGNLVIQDASRPPNFPIWAQGIKTLRVTAWKVKPSDWERFQTSRYRSKERFPLDLPPDLKRSIRIDDINRLSELSVDLSSLLSGGLGHVVIRVERPDERRSWASLQWFQRTHIGVDAWADHDGAYVWTTALKDGAPKAGVQLKLGQAQASSDAQGLARFPLPKAHSSVLLAKAGADEALLPVQRWERHNLSHPMRSILVDDRGLYKPGETAEVRGWLRVWEPGAKLRLPKSKAVRYRLRGPRGNEWAKGQAQLDRFGGFQLALKIPEDANLGDAWLSVDHSEGGARHRISVQAYRKPEFEVNLSAAPGPYLVGEHLDVEGIAKYYTGGGLPNTPFSWVVTEESAQYSPPGHEGFSFGPFVSWWGRWFGREDDKKERQELRGRTDHAGKDSLRIELLSSKDAGPMRISVEGSAEDLNHQRWSDRYQSLVHPAELYVGVRQKDFFGTKDKPVEAELIVTDIDGAIVEGQAARLHLEPIRYGDEAPEAEPTQTVQSTAEPLSVKLTPKKTGRYRLVAEVKDGRGRLSKTTLEFWVIEEEPTPDVRLRAAELQLVKNKEDYKPGDTAEVLLAAPFAGAEGRWALVSGQQLLKEARFRIEGDHHLIKLPLTEAMLPGVHLRVELVGEQDDNPAFAGAEVELPISAASRRLAVSIEPKHRILEPGGQAELRFMVTDAAGAPTKADLAVFVVDEAVLSLTDYKLPDPVAALYPKLHDQLRGSRSRPYVIIERPDDQPENEPVLEEGQVMMKSAMAPMADAAPAPRMARKMENKKVGGAAQGPAIALRKKLEALAHYTPSLPTDQAGKARLKFRLPDNLTRYRVMVLALDTAERAGKGSAAITARRPLMVRPSPPRFSNLKDNFQLPVLVENRSGEPREVQVALRAANANVKAAGKAVTVPDGDRAEVSFDVTVQDPGELAFQVVAASKKLSDAVERKLPVFTPASAEAFAIYGSLKDGLTVQPIDPPKGVLPGFGGLQVRLSTTQLSALSDAYAKLSDYPFDCSEQIASRLIANCTLDPVLREFKDSGWDDKAAGAQRAVDVKALAGRQGYDGGWGFWPSGRTWPFISIHVMHALSRAKTEGSTVPPEVKQRGLSYLKNIKRHFPGFYSDWVRRQLRAYALYTRQLWGDAQPALAAKLIDEAGGVDKAPLGLLGWLYPVLLTDKAAQAGLLKELRRRLNNLAVEQAGTAHFATSHKDGAYLILHSSRRVDALMLNGMLIDAPDNPLVEKLARGLLAHRTAGRFASTQESAWALIALKRYFEVYEKEVPQLTAQLWLGEATALKQRYRGRQAGRGEATIPMDYLEKAGAKDLLMQVKGKGRLYYRLGMRYAPADLILPAEDRGFVITRRYEAVDDKADVRQEPDGSWHIKAGATVKVVLSMVSRERRYHVALYDPLPAGLEPQNPALAVTPGNPEPEPQKPGPFWWWGRPWYEHQNLRDDHAEAFASLLYSGEYEYSYYARATTRGVFTAPPTRAEEMYSPEVFGRGPSIKVVVE